MSPAELAEREAHEAARGRPRSADRTAAILDAAVDVMHDLGWDGFKVQEVARRAGAGLATIYRRWPTKEDLVADAIRHDGELDPTGLPGSAGPAAAGADLDARARLHAQVLALGDKMCGKGGSVISVFAAARDHAAMRSAIDEVIAGTVRPGLVEAIGDALGPDHPQVATAADAVLGILFLRAGILELDTTGEELADEMLALVDALMPAP